MSQAARNITMIPATIQRYSVHNASLTERKRVAGYARVSTDDEEQQTSYEAQVDYYTRYIQSKPEWKFVEVYTDEYASIQVLLEWARGSSAGDFSGINQRCYPCRRSSLVIIHRQNAA